MRSQLVELCVAMNLFLRERGCTECPNTASVTPRAPSSWSGKWGTIDRPEETPQLTHFFSVIEDNEANYGLDIKIKLCALDFVHMDLAKKPCPYWMIVHWVSCKGVGKRERGKAENFWGSSMGKNTFLLTHFTSDEYVARIFSLASYCSRWGSQLLVSFHPDNLVISVFLAACMSKA